MTKRTLGGLMVAAALTLPAPATAAVTIGQTGPVGVASCNPNATWVQDSTAPDSPSYVVPQGGGVITSWKHDRGDAAATAQLRLKVFRPISPGNYLTVGHSDFETLTQPGDNTFATRIAVEAGDHLGFRLGNANFSCRRSGSPGEDVTLCTGADPAVGEPVMFGPCFTALLNLAATVEPDCDGDGFGDETQDPELFGGDCPPRGRTVTLDANKNRVKLGKKVTLSGQVTELARAGECQATQAVELQRKRPKQTTFTTVEQLQTDGAGGFSTKTKVKKTYEYRAQVGEAGGCGGGVSNTETVKAKKPK